MPKLHSIDLFAGCGGLSLGLENAGFETAFVNELNKDAMNSFLINRDQKNPLLRSKYSVHDVKELVKNQSAAKDLVSGLTNDYRIDPDFVPLLVGGPPCQGYSGIGHRRSYSVDKEQLPSNHLYQDMAYIVSQVRPMVFLFENVRGLLSAKWTTEGEKGEIWEDVKATFESLDGYSVRHKLVFAKDYGVPQNRPRVILVGVREDVAEAAGLGTAEDPIESGFLPKPTKGAPDICDLLGDLVDPSFEYGGETRFYPSSANSAIQKALREDPTTGKVRTKGSRLSEHEYSKHAPHIIEKFQYMIDNDGKIPPHLATKKFAQRVLPERWGDSGPSITATSLPDDYVHFSQARSLTVREWARIQLFPDWYEFAGKRTTGGLRRAGNPREGVHDREVPKYTQIGNAVPVGLAEAIGKHLRKIIEAR